MGTNSRFERKFMLVFGIPIILLLGILVYEAWPLILSVSGVFWDELQNASVFGYKLWHIALSVAGAIAYLSIGFPIARWYGSKIEEFEKEFFRQCGKEFSMWRTGSWTALMFLLWIFILPYEYFTHFRRWRTPCYRVSDQY